MRALAASFGGVEATATATQPQRRSGLNSEEKNRKERRASDLDKSGEESEQHFGPRQTSATKDEDLRQTKRFFFFTPKYISHERH